MNLKDAITLQSRLETMLSSLSYRELEPDNISAMPNHQVNATYQIHNPWTTDSDVDIIFTVKDGDIDIFLRRLHKGKVPDIALSLREADEILRIQKKFLEAASTRRVYISRIIKEKTKEKGEANE